MSDIHNEVIRASEIGEYVHCERAWWLGHVQGVENANRASMDAGTEQHQAHGQRVRRATVMQYAALVFVAVAFGAGLLLLLEILKPF